VSARSEERELRRALEDAQGRVKQLTKALAVAEAKGAAHEQLTREVAELKAKVATLEAQSGQSDAAAAGRERLELLAEVTRLKGLVERQGTPRRGGQEREALERGVLTDQVAQLSRQLREVETRASGLQRDRAALQSEVRELKERLAKAEVVQAEPLERAARAEAERKSVEEALAAAKQKMKELERERNLLRAYAPKR